MGCWRPGWSSRRSRDRRGGRQRAECRSARGDRHAGGARAGGGGDVIRGVGEHGLLVETGALESSHRLDALLRDRAPEGVVEVVPGPETVLVVAPGANQDRLRTALGSLLAGARDA